MKESLLDEKRVEYKIDYKDGKSERGPCIHIATAFFSLGILALLVTASMEMYQYKCNKNINIDCRSRICLKITSTQVDSITNSDSDVEFMGFVSKINSAFHKYPISSVFIPFISMINLGKKFETISENLHKHGIAVLVSDIPLVGNCQSDSNEAENYTRQISNSLPFVDGLVINPDLPPICSGLEVASTVKFVEKFTNENTTEKTQKQKRSIKLFVESFSETTTSDDSIMDHSNPLNQPIENTTTILRFKFPSQINSNYEGVYDSTHSLAIIDPQLVQVQNPTNDYRTYFNLLFLHSILPQPDYILNEDPEFELAFDYFTKIMKTYERFDFNQFGISKNQKNLILHAADLINRSVLAVCYPNLLDGCKSFIQGKSPRSTIFGAFNRQNITFAVDFSDQEQTSQTDLSQYHAIFHFDAFQLFEETSIAPSV